MANRSLGPAQARNLRGKGAGNCFGGLFIKAEPTIPVFTGLLLRNLDEVTRIAMYGK